jgi:hypothetical protein
MGRCGPVLSLAKKRSEIVSAMRCDLSSQAGSPYVAPSSRNAHARSTWS